MAFANGHDMTERFNLNDGLGKMYTGLAAAWSSLLFAGMLFLVSNQELPFLRIRNIPLSIGALGTLHVYWLLCLLAYGLNGHFPCAAEYWIMNIYLPLGIGLFHASNTQLLYVADIQRKYASADMVLGETEALIRRNCDPKSPLKLSRSFHLIKKTMSCIMVAFVVQLLCALGVFLISRKFHDGFGLIGQVAPNTPMTEIDCRKGWEWVLSVIWQVFWSWMYAPYLLWKLRDVRDIHGWRVQTMICCIAGLPASPMWLMALYVPQMSFINVYYIPPMWFAPSILIIEAFMIFLPCWHIVQHRRLTSKTLNILEEWEKSNAGSSVESDTTRHTRPCHCLHDSPLVNASAGRKVRCHMYTSAALEKALQTNPVPLLLFAALKDFSGENISFLTHVYEWKKGWLQSRSSIMALRTPPIYVLNDSQLHYRQFVRAIEIYSSFVCLRYSNFPINISYAQLKELADMFAEPAASVIGEPAESLGAIAPFDSFLPEPVDLESAISNDKVVPTSSSTQHNSTGGTEQKTDPKAAEVINSYKMKDLRERMPSALPIPSSFGPEVFDRAAESIKYLVLTNTWPKFVEAGYTASTDKITVPSRFHKRLCSCGFQRPEVSSV